LKCSGSVKKARIKTVDKVQKVDTKIGMSTNVRRTHCYRCHRNPFRVLRLLCAQRQTDRHAESRRHIFASSLLLCLKTKTGMCTPLEYKYFEDTHFAVMHSSYTCCPFITDVEQIKVVGCEKVFFQLLTHADKTSDFCNSSHLITKLDQ
jgi:hypothetical protein